MDSRSFIWTILTNWNHQTSIVQAIPINGQSLKSTVRTIPINRETPTSFDRTIPIVRRYQTLFVQTISNKDSSRRQSSEQIKLINGLRNQLSKRFQLLDIL